MRAEIPMMNKDFALICMMTVTCIKHNLVKKEVLII